MRAEEARELALSKTHVDISFFINSIIIKANNGMFECGFNSMTEGEMDMLLELGYEVHSDGISHIIKW